MLLTVLGIGIFIALAYKRKPAKVWIPAAGVVLAILTIFDNLSFLSLLILWAGFAGLSLLFTQTELRHRYLSKPMLHFVRKVLPPLSTTEQEALDAGHVWWEGDLFQGTPDWHKLHTMQKPELTKEELAFLDNQVETFCSLIDDWQTMHDNDLPKKAWEYLKKERFLGMVIPKQYGGLGFSALAHSCVITKIASRSCSAAISTMVPNSLGPGELLQHYGTEEQKNHYLPLLAAGKEIPCFALTGLEAGSDAGGMNDKGIVCKGMHEGKEIIGIKLSWDKRYITLAPIATLLGLAFKLYDPDKLLGGKKNIGITLCLVPTSHPGVVIGKRHCPMNMPFMNGPTSGKDVFIPLDWIIGGPKMAGHGWKMLMECLSVGRAISLPAVSTAAGKLLFRMTGAYSRIRKQFKLSIGKFEGVQEALARIGGYTYILEAARLLAAGAVDQGVKPAVASAIAKYHMTEMLRSVVNDALDIHAGRGIQFGPRNYLSQCYMGVPVGITVEGANILTRSLIIFGQGAVRCHPFIRYEMAAAALEDEKQATKEFDKLLVSHIGYAVSNTVRSLVNGLTGSFLIKSPVTGPTAVYYKQLTRMSTALAFIADIAMLVLGGNLKRRELLSARLGDVLSALYLSSAVLKYYQDNGQKESDLPYVQWAIQTQLSNIQKAFDNFFMNFPNRILGLLLRITVFPLGRVYKAPSDANCAIIAEHMMQASEFRNRLTEYCYLGNSVDDAVGRMEHVFGLSIIAEPIAKKLQNAIRSEQIAKNVSQAIQIEEAITKNIITEEEAALLQEFEKARLDALKVDEFDSLSKNTKSTVKS